MFTPTFLPLLLLALLTLHTTPTHSSPSPALVSEEYMHLIPLNTLFFRRQSSSSNLQAFTQALGGISADPITSSGNPKRPFQVDGDTFTDFDTAAQRSCDNQANKCSKAANERGNNGGGGNGGNKDKNKDGGGNGDGDGGDNGDGGDGGDGGGGGGNGGGNGNGGGGFKVGDCDEQKNKCKDAQKNAKATSFDNNNNNNGQQNQASPAAATNIGPDPDFPDFDLICDA